MSEPWKEKRVKRDKDNIPGPNVWNPNVTDFELQEGKISDLKIELIDIKGQIEKQAEARIEEHLWITGDVKPIPVMQRAMGVEYNPLLKRITIMIWNGSTWEDVL